MQGDDKNGTVSPQDNFDIYITDYHNSDLENIDQDNEDEIIPTSNCGRIPIETHEDTYHQEHSETWL